MKTQAQIVKATIRSPYMRDVISRKGWSEQNAAYKVVEFITCGKKISLFDFMEAQ